MRAFRVDQPAFADLPTSFALGLGMLQSLQYKNKFYFLVNQNSLSYEEFLMRPRFIVEGKKRFENTTFSSAVSMYTWSRLAVQFDQRIEHSE